MNKWLKAFINIVFVIVLIVNSVLIMIQITQGITIELFENLDWNDQLITFVPIIPHLCWLTIIIGILYRFRENLAELIRKITKLSILGTELEFSSEIKQYLEQAIRSYKGEEFYISEEQLNRVLEHAKRVREDLQNARILWVDRNIVANANIYRFLNDLGVNIDNATSNEQVKAAMDWAPGAYEVVVTNMNHLNENLDQNYNEQAGIELIKHIREHDEPEVKNKKVILFIATNPDDRDYGFDEVTNEVDTLLIRIFEFIELEHVSRKYN